MRRFDVMRGVIKMVHLNDAAAELRLQAFDARALSDTFSHPESVSDLQKFAAALERDASELMLGTLASAAL
jgi:hypothetical protein